MQQETTRQLLIDAIIDLAGDEFEKPDDYVVLSKKSDNELVKELINIAEYFRDRD
jgi:hypothetical protein